MAKIDLSNFRVIKTGNADIERNYVNDILHAITDKLSSIEADGIIVTVHGDGATTNVDNTDPENPIVDAQPALGAAKAYTDALAATLGTAATHDVPAAGDAGPTEVVLGNDSRLGGGGSSDGALTIQLGSDPGLLVAPTTLGTQARFFQCPATYTFTDWQIVADRSCTVSVDIRAHVFPALPSSGDSITADNPITLAAATNNNGSTSSWGTTTVNRGDWIAIVLTANDAATWLSIQLQGTKS